MSTRRDFVRSGAFLLGGLLWGTAADAADKEYLVYIGTLESDMGPSSTRARSKGIYMFRFQPATGKLTPATLIAEASDPAFLAVHPNHHFLYAANEHNGEDKPGKNDFVSAFAINLKSGALTFLNKVSARGEGPAHIAIDREGKGLMVANYRSGSVALLPIAPDGQLREATAFDQHHGRGATPRQDRPRAHGAVFSPDNRFGLVAEHGIDEIMIYHYDAAQGALAPNDPPFFKLAPGDAPRHLLFHPNGRVLYSLNEIGSTVTVLAYGAADGTLKQVQEITTAPSDFKGNNTTAQLQLGRAGKFLYVSNRGADTIALFAVNPTDGSLQLVEQVSTLGKTPRDFCLDPTGSCLLVGNQNSDDVVLFKVDAKTGRLTPTGQLVENILQPSCVVFVQAE